MPLRDVSRILAVLGFNDWLAACEIDWQIGFLLTSMGESVIFPHGSKPLTQEPIHAKYLSGLYDICDPKRLRKVFKTMRDFGDHLQYSIFECQFNPIDLAKCRHALSEIIKHNEDQVLFVDLVPT